MPRELEEGVGDQGTLQSEPRYLPESHEDKGGEGGEAMGGPIHPSIIRAAVLRDKT